MIGLTRMEGRCLAFIEAYDAEHGLMPSQREITDGLNLKSTSRANTLITALVERGRLKRVPRRPRALAIVRKVHCPKCNHGFEPLSRQPAPKAARAHSPRRGDA